MKVTTAQQMRDIDKANIEKTGIPGIVLMENAARGVADEACCFIEKNFGKTIILCGKGNNGGDGFACARLINDRGYNVKVVVVGDEKDIKGDALINYNIAKRIGVEIENVEDFDFRELQYCSLIIDALYGTGIKGALREPSLSLVTAANSAKQNGVHIISVDIPSGVNSDNGHVEGECINADVTITFGLPKIGIILYPGAEYAGEIKVHDISLQNTDIDIKSIKGNILTPKEAKAMLPKRPKRSNKGTFGRLFVFAGSQTMTGAAYLCCKSAYKTGAGVVYSCIPESVVGIVQTLIPEAVEIPLYDDGKGVVSYKSYEEVKHRLKEAKAFVIGCGIGTDECTKEFVEAVIGFTDSSKPIVVDADGLNVLAGNAKALKTLKERGNTIITPHPGEMSRLTGKSIVEILSDTISTALEFAKQNNTVVVLKDARTIIASPEGEFYINTTGCAAMAKGGSGDVLSGIIGGLLSQGMSSFDAAVLGVHIHGLAGERASASKGEYGVLAGDTAENIVI